ncbi:MAG: TonB-dependent receptor [Acidiferrobacterales bacterium]|nr:TonB-dependent receptor [Acidiferrobacterales bacterium]
MKSPFKLLLSGAALSMLMPATSIAQDSVSFEIEEIVVTGRKREESLQDIPVSISVVGADMLAEQNVLSMGDLAELVPGLNYSQGENGPFDDRIAGLTSIRGVQSNEIATNRTKVTSFVDGMPIIGSVGAINIGGSSQVEVYSGPQSAAFGRSTFAGAINYVTNDPSEELGGTVGLNLSDQGTRILNGSVGGPITDTLGFQIGASYEDSVSPDSSLYTYTDGIEGDTRGGLNYSARLVWTPTDNLKTKLTFTHDETDDGPTPNFYATQASSQACFNSLNTIQYIDAMGMNAVGVDGVFDCDLELDRSAVPLGINDISAYYNTEAGAAFLQEQVANAVAAGATGDVEGAIRTVAEAWSMDEPGSKSERDRVLLQTDYLLENGGAIQFSFMKSEDYYSRFTSGASTVEPLDTTFNAMTGFYSYNVPMGMFAEEDPTEADETYIELRWASPSEERIRYLVGASYYDYSFLTSIYRGGYAAVRAGVADEVLALTGVDYSVPDTLLGEDTTNTALFGSINYDFTDKLVGSIEARYANDEVGASNPNNGVEVSTESTSFVPRFGLNYSPNESTTLYFQYAIGKNPSGVSSDLLDPTSLDYLNNGVPIDLDPTDNDPTTTRVKTTDFTSDDFLFYDEETLTNYEFGFKGNALDGRLSYTGAIYYALWEDAIQPSNLSWAYAYADNDLAGTLVDGLDGVYYVEESDNTTARITANAGTSETMGLELQGNYRFNDQWSLGANLSLMSAQYKDYCSIIDFSGTGNDLGAYAGVPISADDNGDPCYVLDGLNLRNQPALTIGLSPSYRTDLGNGMQFSANARLNYRDKTYADDLNVQQTPESTTLNLTFGLSKDAWSGSFYIENVFDDTTATSGTPETAQQFLGDYPTAVLDESLFFTSGTDTYSHYNLRYPVGRNFGLRVNYRF